jgi:hypothetical protein
MIDNALRKAAVALNQKENNEVGEKIPLKACINLWDFEARRIF